MSELARNLGVEIEFLDHSSRGPHRRYYTKADQIASATSGDIVRGILNGGVEVGNIRADSTFGELLGLTRGEIIIP